MHDNDVENSQTKRWSRSPNLTRDMIAMVIGAVVGGVIGMIIGNAGIAGAGAAMGAGVGWGVSADMRSAGQLSVKGWASTALGAIVGGIVLGYFGSLIGWPIFTMVGIALGASFGSIAVRKYVLKLPASD